MEYPNLAAVSILLKSFIKPFQNELELLETPIEQFLMVRRKATELEDEEITRICDYIGARGIVETFFRGNNEAI